MSSSDSNSSNSSSNGSELWPCNCSSYHKESDFDEYDSSFEDEEEYSSEQSKDEEDDLWTNRKNIFISVFNINNYKDTMLITNYNELHTYRDKYAKLSKKSADNINNIWSEVKVNIPKTGIVPLKSYEKELIDTKKKTKAVKKPTSIPKQNENIVDKTMATSKPSNQITTKVNAKPTNKINTVANNKENISIQNNIAQAPTKVAQVTKGNKTTLSSGHNKDEKRDKGVRVDIVVHNVTKSELDKKNTNTKSTNSIVKSNETNKKAKSNPSEAEFKKPQSKSDSKNNKVNKSNSKEIISETKTIKRKKRKQKNSYSQSSENSSDIQRSSSVDSSKSLKGKAKKKIEELHDDTTDNNEDEDEEIIDNMDALTGDAKVIDHEMLKIVKYKEKEKKKPVETPKVAEKKVIENNNQEESRAVSPVNNDLDTSPINYMLCSEKYAENSVDMVMDNNLMGALESIIEALQFNPGDDRHYLNRCYCYLRLNRPALAIADAQYVLQTSAHYGHRFIAYLRAGQASMALQKYTQAENLFKDSLSINCDNLYAQREYMRAKISRIVSLGYTEKNAVLALLKYPKTQEAISYLANKKFANNENKSDNFDKHFDDTDDLNDLYYSSDEDEKPNCTTLINNTLNHEPGVTKFFHLLAKPNNMTASTSLPPAKNPNSDIKKKNATNNKTNTGRVMERAIWVGSLTKDITDAVLRKKFKQYGTVTSIYCPPNEAYAFVNFEKSEHVENVLKNPSASVINGHKLIIRQGMYRK